MPGNIVAVRAQGIEAAADTSDIRSPETYIGYARAEHFASPGGFRQDARRLTLHLPNPA